MDDALFALVFDRLADAKLDKATEDTILAACESPTSLEALLANTGFVTPTKPVLDTSEDDPAGAYLASVSVQGFRGVGSKLTLNLPPGDGLTVIVGRNGSGKSSIAEGLEVLLTGRMSRWEERTEVWKTGWRNLHAGLPPQVEAELFLEGRGIATLSRTWKDSQDLEAGEASVHVSGEKAADFSSLGWDDALIAFRPMLAHSELESFFRRPSDLYDLLSNVLGLEELADVSKRLAQARLASDKAVKLSRDALPPMLDRLGKLDDERATRCAAALGMAKPNLEGVEAIVTGTSSPSAGSNLDWLRQLTAITLPSEEDVHNVVAALEQAIAGVKALSGTDASRADETAKVLRAAISHFESHGPGPCLVCGTEGTLNDAWAERTKVLAAQLEGEAAAVRKAATALAAAIGLARRLVVGVPTCIAAPVDSTPPVSDATTAWASWGVPDLDTMEPHNLLDHLQTTWEPLSAAVEALKAAAESELKAKEDQWTPVALDVMKWCTTAKQVRGPAAHIPNIKRAEDWLKKTNSEILNDRLRPLADQARSIWDVLKQGSNVALSKIHLEGTSTHRRVEFDVEIDGSEGSALGVMSQGEVNALALSVFIPRAMTPDSPFRFLVIDDPIQAMDPSKVDGFARVLETAAEGRQVVVFTHDNRLPEAIRRLNIEASVFEVTRRPKSQMEIVVSQNPVDRAFGEALAVALDEHLSPEIAERIVGPLCRHGIEAAFVELGRRKLFASGMEHAKVDELVAAANTTNKKAALGLFGDWTRTADVLTRLNSIHSWMATTFKLVNSSAHVPRGTDLKRLIDDCRDLVKKL